MFAVLILRVFKGSTDPRSPRTEPAGQSQHYNKSPQAYIGMENSRSPAYNGTALTSYISAIPEFSRTNMEDLESPVEPASHDCDRKLTRPRP